MDNNHLRTRVRRLLQTHGWALLDSTAVACRDFRTAVGIKRAFVYLADFGPGSANVMLQGDYRSEGRNILESRSVLIPKDASPRAVRELVAQFATSAYRGVRDSYAARLLQAA